MDVRLMWWPAFTMVALTIAVWFCMYRKRISEMKRERIHPQSIATSAAVAARLQDTNCADNFKNLFELPVLFYLALAIAVHTAQVTWFTLALAWLFVALRVVHSGIQCTYNKVLHRFYAYFAGGIALWTLWAVLAFGLLK
jgi:hypothetical protein